ncbi:MAG: L-histidine N(alpha)-methyltransferase [Marinobacter sp.]|uniref:L-histidine N(alpha)-methyltransferase n=1 Tax=Marinobacter sp. TaxID=50741 RepID=UPI003299E086
MALDKVENGRNVHGLLQQELLEGLQARERNINPKFFYDVRGSELFSAICELPEYYPTRTEIGIFKTHGASIAASIGPDCELLEPGAGGCEKVRYLITDLQPAAYMPLDISGDYLLAAAGELRESFPGLQVLPLVADFSVEFEWPEIGADGRRVLFYPGSTIGNFEPEAARSFLRRVAALVGSGGGLLIGVDLHKDSAVLNAAYNDSLGVTADFNRNILHHANSLLDGDLQPELFEHLAFYNEAERRIEMHLECSQDHAAHCGGEQLEFVAGERIHTEYSYKYSLDDFKRLAASAGFTPRATWVDEQDWFSVQYFEVD